MLAIMATRTATIRVARETRNRLAAEARQQGVSVSELLAAWSRKAELEAIFRQEREAARADSGDRPARAEEREWEGTLKDGLD
jgi:hypothetical protein